MRIAFLTHYTELYGANRSLINLIEGLLEYDIEPFVFSPSNGDLVEELKNRNISVHIIPFETWTDIKLPSNIYYVKLYRNLQYRFRSIKRFCKNIVALQALIQQLKLLEISVIYTNSAVIPLGALAAQKLKIFHVWHIREFLDLDYNLHLDCGKIIFNYFLNKADAKIAVSQSIKNHFWKESQPSSVHVIYNGVASLKKIDELKLKCAERNIDDHDFTFLIIGLIHDNKGQKTAIKALANVIETYPTARLLVVGNGDIDSLEKLSRKLNISRNVIFWGYIADPYLAYLSSDVVLMCSRNEAMGRVTVEAMSACKPVIGYRNGGTVELIQHQKTGLLYKGSEEELAFCMRQFLEQPELSTKMGKEAWEYARHNFTVENYSKNVYEVLVALRAKEY